MSSFEEALQLHHHALLKQFYKEKNRHDPLIDRDNVLTDDCHGLLTAITAQTRLLQRLVGDISALKSTVYSQVCVAF